MAYKKRNLPHIYEPEATLFVTWSLFGSMPARRKDDLRTEGLLYSAGRDFVMNDRALDRAKSGPRWQNDPRVAQVIAQAIERGASDYGLYDLLAWAVMSNHVHIVIKAHVDLPKITRWLKGSTARSANLLLNREGNPFWQYESYDHGIRNTDELNRIIRYVERNPVAAGLVGANEDWPWSSASACRPKACSTGA